MKKLLVAALFTLALLQVGAGETVLRKVGDYTLDTKTHGKPWKNIFSKSFYFPGKIFNDNRGKTLEFRADARCLAGSSDLRSALRLSTNPGNKLRLSRSFPPLQAVKGNRPNLSAVSPFPTLRGSSTPISRSPFTRTAMNTVPGN